MSKFVEGIEFVVEHCCNCGIAFAMTRDFQRRRLAEQDSFYCPAGHGQRYTGKTKEQKLKDQLAVKQRALEAEAARAMIFRDQRDTVRKSYQKMRTRVKNGVCPCCNRAFQNLQQHMATKHPDFSDGEQFKVLRNIYGLTQKAAAEEIGVSATTISYYERGHYISVEHKSLIDDWVSS